MDEREIAVAYGRRSLRKLISVLQLPHHTPEELTHCLEVILSLLCFQEQKNEAINLGAAECLIRHVCSESNEVTSMACKALSSMAQMLNGREETVRHGGIEALASAMQRAPVEASACLMAISRTLDGAHAIFESDANVVQALVDVSKACHPRTTQTIMSLEQELLGHHACFPPQHAFIDRSLQQFSLPNLYLYIHPARATCRSWVLQYRRCPTETPLYC